MSDTPNKIWEYPTLQKLVTRLRDDLNNKDAVLLFAYNGTDGISRSPQTEPLLNGISVPQ